MLVSEAADRVLDLTIYRELAKELRRCLSRGNRLVLQYTSHASCTRDGDLTVLIGKQGHKWDDEAADKSREWEKVRISPSLLRKLVLTETTVALEYDVSPSPTSDPIGPLLTLRTQHSTTHGASTTGFMRHPNGSGQTGTLR